MPISITSISKAAGASGFSGWSGRSGFSGFSGSGVSGFSGFSGSGISGFSGWSGTNGTAGTSGFSGWSGTNGTNGTSGFSGYSGTNGTNGTNGTAGTSGFSGYSGTSGYSGPGANQTLNTSSNVTFSSVTSGNFYVSSDTNNRFTAGVLVLRNTAPTVYFRDTDHKSAMIHNNSNLLYVLGGANDSETWTQVNSQWPWIWNLTNNDSTCGGSLYAIGNVTAYYSDKRLKNIKGRIENAIEKIKQISGYYYVENDLARKHGYNNQKEQVGVIAQEIENVLPEIVEHAPFDMVFNNQANTYISKSGEYYKTVKYERLIPLLIEAIKEQQDQIEVLQKQILDNKGVS